MLNARFECRFNLGAHRIVRLFWGASAPNQIFRGCCSSILGTRGSIFKGFLLFLCLFLPKAAHRTPLSQLFWRIFVELEPENSIAGNAIKPAHFWQLQPASLPWLENSHGISTKTLCGAAAYNLYCSGKKLLFELCVPIKWQKYLMQEVPLEN